MYDRGDTYVPHDSAEKKERERDLPHGCDVVQKKFAARRFMSKEASGGKPAPRSPANRARHSLSNIDALSSKGRLDVSRKSHTDHRSFEPRHCCRTPWPTLPASSRTRERKRRMRTSHSNSWVLAAAQEHQAQAPSHDRRLRSQPC